MFATFQYSRDCIVTALLAVRAFDGFAHQVRNHGAFVLSLVAMLNASLTSSGTLKFMVAMTSLYIFEYFNKLLIVVWESATF
jgi:hypothetical protein